MAKLNSIDYRVTYNGPSDRWFETVHDLASVEGLILRAFPPDVDEPVEFGSIDDGEDEFGGVSDYLHITKFVPNEFGGHTGSARADVWRKDGKFYFQLYHYMKRDLQGDWAGDMATYRDSDPWRMVPTFNNPTELADIIGVVSRHLG